MSVISDFTKDFQITLITNLTHNYELFQTASKVLKIEDFDNTACKLIYETLQEYGQEFRQQIPISTLITEITRKLTIPGASSIQVLPEEKEALGIVLDRVCNAEELDSEYYKNKIPEYLKYIRGLKLVGTLENSQGLHVDNMDAFINKVSQLKTDILETASAEVRFTNPSVQHMPVTKKTIMEHIGTGIRTLDDRINGGLIVTGLGMITACPGIGKTTTLLNFAHGATKQFYRSLVFTLEMAEARIIHRMHAINMNIKAGLFEIPMENWPDEMLELYNYVISPEYPQHGYVTVADLSTRQSYTTDDIDRFVERWLRDIEKEFGAAEVKKCKGAYLDWLDCLIPTKQQLLKADKAYSILPAMLTTLGTIARRYDLAFWTATQGTAAADGVEKVRMKHTAFAYHKNDPLDVGIGVAVLNTDSTQEMITEVKLKDDNINKVLVDCNRHLSYNINKNRDNPTTAVTLYQGPSLRLFNKEAEWRTIEAQIKEKNYTALFGHKI
ncbi:DnaB-like helicase C-terminal domain-containing protein [Verrucomicrobiota bacterium]